MNRFALTMMGVLAAAGTVSSAALADVKPVAQETQVHAPTLLGYRVSSVTPHWVEESNGKRTRHLAGADLRIEAQPGMTAEYLTVELHRELVAIALHGTAPQSVFGVEGTRCEVRSVGDGFVIRVTAPDAKGAKEVVRRAYSLG